MARGNVKILTQIPAEFSIDYIVAAGTVASVSAGEPVVSVLASGAAATGVVALAADGAGVIGTTASVGRFAGVSKSDSAETAAAAGAVTCWMPLPGLIYSAKALVAANANTAAEVNALKMKMVVFDLTSTVWTVDTAATDAAANALVIVGGDYNTSTIYFTIKPAWSVLGSTSTMS